MGLRSVILGNECESGPMAAREPCSLRWVNGCGGR